MGQKDGPYLLSTSLTVCLASFLDNGRNLKLRPVVWWAWAVAPWQPCLGLGPGLQAFLSPPHVEFSGHTQDRLPPSRSQLQMPGAPESPIQMALA